jgi:hypothetical protein
MQNFLSCESRRWQNVETLVGQHASTLSLQLESAVRHVSGAILRGSRTKNKVVAVTKKPFVLSTTDRIKWMFEL